MTVHASGWLEKDPTRGIKIGEPIGPEGAIDRPCPVESNLRAATEVPQEKLTSSRDCRGNGHLGA